MRIITIRRSGAQEQRNVTGAIVLHIDYLSIAGGGEFSKYTTFKKKDRRVCDASLRRTPAPSKIDRHRKCSRRCGYGVIPPWRSA